MKIILRSDLDGLGKRGDIVDVADGYARNFLFPKGHALVASDGAVEQAGRMRKARDERDSSRSTSWRGLPCATSGLTSTTAAASGFM